MGLIRRRNPWRVVRAVAFGVVMTLAMVLFPAAFIDVGTSQQPTPTSHPYRVPEYLAGLTPAYSHTTVSENGGFKFRSGLRFEPGFGMDSLEFVFGDPTTTWDATSGSIPPYVGIIRQRFGWPWRAAYWDTFACTPGPRSNPGLVNAFFSKAIDRAGPRYGLAYPRWLPAGDRPAWRRLPVLPLWAGLLGDVALYTLVWAMGGFALRSARRWRRRTRGRCEWCGYTIGDAANVCPECGGGTA